MVHFMALSLYRSLVRDGVRDLQYGGRVWYHSIIRMAPDITFLKVGRAVRHSLVIGHIIKHAQRTDYIVCDGDVDVRKN